VGGRWDYDSMFIDGAWTSEGTVGVIEVVDPATEEVIGSVPNADPKAAHTAIASARRAVRRRTLAEDVTAATCVGAAQPALRRT
jgi:acyl-CoA reductase-like NAD-dependent aldehyde dehydrogenase